MLSKFFAYLIVLLSILCVACSDLDEAYKGDADIMIAGWDIIAHDLSQLELNYLLTESSCKSVANNLNWQVQKNGNINVYYSGNAYLDSLILTYRDGCSNVAKMRTKAKKVYDKYYKTRQSFNDFQDNLHNNDYSIYEASKLIGQYKQKQKEIDNEVKKLTIEFLESVKKYNTILEHLANSYGRQSLTSYKVQTK